MHSACIWARRSSGMVRDRVKFPHLPSEGIYPILAVNGLWEVGCETEVVLVLEHQGGRAAEILPNNLVMKKHSFDTRHFQLIILIWGIWSLHNAAVIKREGIRRVVLCLFFVSSTFSIWLHHHSAVFVPMMILFFLPSCFLPPLLSGMGRKNRKIRKLMGWDKDRDIAYQIPVWAK